MNQSDASGSKAGDLVSLSDEKKVIEVVSASILLELVGGGQQPHEVEAHRARAVSCDHLRVRSGSQRPLGLSSGA